ncbi:MAG TPA: hypothetical protein VKA68_08420, partial [bacterium]|nr:hypothetical protein [bacterium]
MRQTIPIFLFIIGLTAWALPARSGAQVEISGYLESDAYVFVRDSVRLANEINELRLKFNTSG